MKIAHRIRTGQDPIIVQSVPYTGPTGVPVSTTPSNGRNGRGNCGPARATNLNSWGAGCPPGVCGPDDLAPALGRQFAGMQNGCRELAWTAAATAATGATLTWTGNSLVTICPTRLIITVPGLANTALITISSIKFGNEEQMVGGPLVAGMFDPTAFQVIPFVMSCLKAGMPFTFVGLNSDGSTRTVYLTFIGPAVG